mmetsp:Transcript_103476/g.194675  ORF Transcript_103476/g.194675 Transcript_103476/m.194675 type:complete len:478 (+) Transcript_103476:31-1464(+)
MLSSLLGALAALLCSLPCDANTRRGPGCSPAARQGYANQWPEGLDFGVYWMGPDHTFEKASSGPSPHYNPNRSTSIFFHGWQGAFGGTTRTCFRMGTKCKSCLGDVEIMDAWFQKGWNVGMFYWDQFADEICVRDAEFKIWNRGNQSLRWVSNDCSGPDYVGVESSHVYDSKSQNVIDLCTENMRSVLQGFAGPELRFVGESLGTQLAAGCAAALHSRDDRMAPSRVVLLEPAFSHYGVIAGQLQCKQIADTKEFGQQAEDNTNAALRKLKNVGVPIELYTSSPLLFKYIVCSNPHVYFDVHVHYEPFWCNHPKSRFLRMDFQNNVACYHDSVVSLYYLSMDRQLSLLDGGVAKRPAGCWVPSAGSSLDEVRDLIQTCKVEGLPPHFVQSQGMMTFDISDDVFSLHDDTPRISVEAIQSKFSEEANSAPLSEGKSDRLTWMFLGSGIMALAFCGIVLRRCNRLQTQAASQEMDELIE